MVKSRSRCHLTSGWGPALLRGFRSSVFKAALALSSRMFSHGHVCKGAAEHLGVCTSVMDCPWLRWLEVSWRHATVTHGNQGALSPRGFPVSAGSQISFRDKSGGRKSTFQNHVCGGGVWLRSLKEAGRGMDMEGRTSRAGKEMTSSNISQRRTQPGVKPSGLDSRACLRPVRVRWPEPRVRRPDMPLSCIQLCGDLSFLLGFEVDT